MRIAVIGNCQTLPLREYFRHALPEAEVFEMEVWRFGGEQIAAAARELDRCDLILSQPLLAEKFAPFTQAELRARAASRNIPVHFFHNIFFQGPLPDCRYLGRIGRRLKSPVSNYHSSIVVEAFLEGCDEAECLGRLRSGHGIEVRQVWDRGIAGLVAREKNVDVPFVEEMVAHAREELSLHYFNHPRPNLLMAYGRKILRQVLSVEADDGDWVLPDILGKYGSWPVHEWVARELGLEYGEEQFVAAHTGERMSLEEFVSRSYALYSATPREELA